MKVRNAKVTSTSALLAAGVALPLAVYPADGSHAPMEEITVFGDASSVLKVPLTATEGIVTEEQIRVRPVSRIGELLEFVPGLVVTQHSGEGKANQYFLRGFNLDHGTDFSVHVDGIPVNMPTHAHGHGYTDLNFLIPELVQRLSYRKGPYYADVGDFSAAGSAEFSYIDSLEHGTLNVTAGSEGYYRAFVGDSYAAADGDVLMAGAVTRYRGPWELDQALNKANGLVKYHREGDRSSWSVTAMAYGSSWNATDQIPLRAVERGQIDRFGNVDPSDGGTSHRYSASFDWERLAGGDSLKVNAYAIDYQLDLFSNFTYFLNNPLRGDQFEQFDDRRVYGLNAVYKTGANVLGVDGEWAAGLQARYDDIRVGLFQTEQRQRLTATRQDDVQQLSVGLYMSLSQTWHEWFRSVTSFRLDRYYFEVDADLPANSGRTTDALISPKLNLVVGPWNRTQYYLSVGRGFHSNDARGTAISIDPATGEDVRAVDPFSKVRSIELGMRSDAIANTQLAVSLFSLRLDSELVFVGDAGATELLDESERFGIEVAAVNSPIEWLTIDADFALTKARLRAATAGNRIPLSVSRAASFGVVTSGPGPWSGGVRFRYLGSAPLTEDDAVRSDSTFTVNLEAGYRLTQSWSLKLGIYNVFDSNENDVTYFYTSRLPGEEPVGVGDLHFHPLEPRAFRLTIQKGAR